MYGVTDTRVSWREKTTDATLLCGLGCLTLATEQLDAQTF
jgi:hypothetical protein